MSPVRRERPDRSARVRRGAALAVAVSGCLLAAVPGGAGADPGRGAGGDPVVDPSTDRGVRVVERQQTSDGLPGEIAEPAPRGQVGEARTRRGRSWQVAPGVRARVWTRDDSRGPVRVHLLRVDPSRPGVGLDYASLGTVRRSGTVSQTLAEDAVGGVNGDFYDIGESGAPLGTGVDQDRGVIHGRAYGWNESFWLRSDGRPAIGTLAVRSSLSRHPEIGLTNLNSPFVYAGGVGAYTPAWGAVPTYRATEGRHRRVRVVQVRRGRVVSIERTLPDAGRVRGLMLLGRGAGAGALSTLRVGERLRLERAVQGDPMMVITGNAVLVRDGEVQVVDDREMHPRTAIGIDRDTGDVLLLAVDGRSSVSRGYTMVETARLLIELGAEQALNLDGGGSTTMVARRRGGVVGVLNTPSDGFERSVANAVEVTYTAPPGG